MEPSTALAHVLVRLSVDGAKNSESLADLLRPLERAVQAAIASYLGIQAMLVDHGHVVAVSRFVTGTQREDIETSLQLPLAAMADVDPASTIVLYAGVSGALVDLATDITYALDLPPSSFGPQSPSQRAAVGDSPRAVAGAVLDSGIPPLTMVSGVRGFDERVAINQAIGVLLADGIVPERTHDELRLRALAADVTVPVLAASLVSGSRGELLPRESPAKPVPS